LTHWLDICLIVLPILIITNLWLIYRVLKPLSGLVAMTHEVSSGNLGAFEQSCGGIAEIGILRHSMASMAGHVRRNQEDGQAYRHALTDGQEAERARIARELHDDTVQALIAVAQSIDLVSAWIETDVERSAVMLKTARNQAVEAVDGLRRLIANLRPPALEELGLTTALQMLAKNEEGVAVKVQTTGKERRLDETRELTLFRSVQEAIQNARRHGQAEHISVEVNYQPQNVCLTVIDDGSGFYWSERYSSFAKSGHYGLLGMKERVHHLNGSVDVMSKPGMGTRLTVTLPLDTHNQPTETVQDPVCGAIIQPHQAYGSVEYEGKRQYFCCPVCQGAFQRDPDTYLSPEACLNRSL
jgi:signal transduction histidine kinase/YHS domain-containing protein